MTLLQKKDSIKERAILDMVTDLKLLLNLDILYDKPIVLYGASTGGVQVQKWLSDIGIQIEYFCDSNLMRWGEIFQGKKILSIQELSVYAESTEIVIIISSEYFKDINEMLEKFHISCEYIFTKIAFQYALYRYLKLKFPKYSDTVTYSVLQSLYEQKKVGTLYSRNVFNTLIK